MSVDSFIADRLTESIEMCIRDRDHIAERNQEEMIEKVMRGQGNGEKKKNEHV